MMRSRWYLIEAAVLCVAISLLINPTAWSQESIAGLEDALVKAGAKREVREVVEIVMFVRLAQELELSEDQTVLLVRRMGEFRDDVSRMHKKRRELRKELGDIYYTQDANEEELLAKLTELRQHDGKLNNLKLDLHEELSEGYDTRTQARLYLFLQEYDESMRRMVQSVRDRARGMYGGRGGRGGRGGGVGRGPMRDEAPRSGSVRGGRGPGPRGADRDESPNRSGVQSSSESARKTPPE